MFLQGYTLSDSPEAHQRSTAKAFHGVSFCCSVASMVWFAVAVLATIIVMGALIGTGYFADNQYYDYVGHYGGCWMDCPQSRYDNAYESSGDFYNYGGDRCIQVCA